MSGDIKVFYMPHAGSVASQVVQFLTANTDEVLDAHAISVKFGCSRWDVGLLLGRSIEAGFLNCCEDLKSGDLIYSLGEQRLSSFAIGPFWVDAAEHPIDRNTPIPKQPGDIEWPQLLDRMCIGDSFVVPHTARDSLHKGLHAYHGATGKTFLRSPSGEGIRVWRTA